MSNEYFNLSTVVTRLTTAKAAAINSLAASVTAAFDKLPGATALATNKVTYATDAGVANAYEASLPLVTAYSEGLKVRIKITNANTGASTLQVNALGARAIKRSTGDDLNAADLAAGTVHEMAYNGTYWELLTAVQSDVNEASASATAAAASAAAAATSETNAAASEAGAATAVSDAIGVTVQGYDADLDAIAGLSFGNNEAPLYNGGWTKFTVSGFARSLLVETAAAGWRNILELGSMAVQAATSVSITGGTINGTAIGGTTPAAGTFTEVLSQASNPNLSLWDTGAAAASKQIRHSYTAGNYDISTYDSSGVRTAVDYRATVGASGITAHSWRIEGTERLSIAASVDFPVSTASAGTQTIRVSAGLSQAILAPTSNGGMNLGSSALRISQTFLQNAPDVSSDARLKENIADLTEAERRAAAKIKTRTFTMKESGKKKVGYIAQEIIEAMASEGLDALEYGLVSDGETYGVDYDAINAFRLG